MNVLKLYTFDKRFFNFTIFTIFTIFVYKSSAQFQEWIKLILQAQHLEL